MQKSKNLQPVDILLVEDNPGDVRLTMEALKGAKVRNKLMVAQDGQEALEMLRKEGEYKELPKPDLILLDLNLPRLDGRELLKIIKSDPVLKVIPVVVLTTSEAEQDIIKAYEYYANAYITKPVDFNQFIKAIESVEGFWLTIVKYPPSK